MVQTSVSALKRNFGISQPRHSLSTPRLDSRRATTPSHNSNTQQTLHLARTANRCRRNRFSADGNMKLKWISFVGRQPCRAQSCQTHEQNGSSLGSSTGPYITGATPLLLTEDLATATMQTPRDDDDDIASLAGLSFESLQPSSL